MREKNKNHVKQFLTLTCACILLICIICPQSSLVVQAAKVGKITLNQKKITIQVGDSKKLTAKISPTNAKNSKITWETSNARIASVKNGKVTGVSTGTATITAKSGGKKATCKVKVELSQTAKKAIKAYRKYLKQSRIKWTNWTYYGREQFKFVLADLNGDGVPELILQNNGGAPYNEGHEAAFCYYNGRVKEIGRDNEIRRYYPEKGMMVTYDSGMNCMESYMKIYKSGRTVEIGRAWSSRSTDGYFDCFSWKGRRVSKTEFKRYVKKAAGKHPMEITDSDWRRNTAANRNKMEKLIKKY